MLKRTTFHHQALHQKIYLFNGRHAYETPSYQPQEEGTDFNIRLGMTGTTMNLSNSLPYDREPKRKAVLTSETTQRKP